MDVIMEGPALRAECRLVSQALNTEEIVLHPPNPKDESIFPLSEAPLSRVSDLGSC